MFRNRYAEVDDADQIGFDWDISNAEIEEWKVKIPPVLELRKLIRELVRKYFPCTNGKNYKWKDIPRCWPEEISFVDPNNKKEDGSGKPRKDELKEMYKFLLKFKRNQDCQIQCTSDVNELNHDLTQLRDCQIQCTDADVDNSVKNLSLLLTEDVSKVSYPLIKEDVSKVSYPLIKEDVFFGYCPQDKSGIYDEMGIKSRILNMSLLDKSEITRRTYYEEPLDDSAIGNTSDQNKEVLFPTEDLSVQFDNTFITSPFSLSPEDMYIEEKSQSTFDEPVLKKPKMAVRVPYFDDHPIITQDQSAIDQPCDHMIITNDHRGKDRYLGKKPRRAKKNKKK